MKQRVKYRGRHRTTAIEHEVDDEMHSGVKDGVIERSRGGSGKESMIIHRIQHTGS